MASESFVEQIVGDPEIRFLDSGKGIAQIDKSLIRSQLKYSNGPGNTNSSIPGGLASTSLIDQKKLGPHLHRQTDGCQFARIRCRNCFDRRR